MTDNRAAIQASVFKKLAEVREISCPECGQEMIRTFIPGGQASYWEVTCLACEPANESRPLRS